MMSTWMPITISPKNSIPEIIPNAMVAIIAIARDSTASGPIWVRAPANPSRNVTVFFTSFPFRCRTRPASRMAKQDRQINSTRKSHGSNTMNELPDGIVIRRGRVSSNCCTSQTFATIKKNIASPERNEKTSRFRFLTIAVRLAAAIVTPSRIRPEPLLPGRSASIVSGGAVRSAGAVRNVGAFRHRPDQCSAVPDTPVILHAP